MRKSIYLLLCIMLCLLLTQTAAFAADEGANIVYASALGHYADFVLTGDTTLIMDTERYLQTIISSDYALTVQGNYTLHVQSSLGNAVFVKSLRSTAPIEILASAYGIVAIENISISNNLIVNSGDTCLHSVNGHITVNGATELTSSNGTAIWAANGCVAIHGGTNHVKIETKDAGGICVYAREQVTLIGATVQITSASPNSLICFDDITLGGKVIINSGLNHYGELRLTDNVSTQGNITILDGSSVTVTGKYGINGQKGIFMNGGTLYVDSKGGNSAVISENGRVSLNGNVTLLSISESGDSSAMCVYGKDGVSLTGGTIQITCTSPTALISLGDMTLSGNIKINAGFRFSGGYNLHNNVAAKNIEILQGSNIVISGRLGLFGMETITMNGESLTVNCTEGNAIEAAYGINLKGMLQIITPENGKISGGTIVDSNNSAAKHIVIENAMNNIFFDANGGIGVMPSETVQPRASYILPSTCSFTAPSGVAYTMEFSGNWMVEGKHAPVGSNNTADSGVYPTGTVITLDGNVTVKPVWDFVTCDVQIDNAHVDEDGFFRLAEGMNLSDVTVSRDSGEIGSFYVYRVLWLENDRIADTNVSALANSSKYTLDATISSGHPGWKITADTKLRFMIGGKVVGESKYSSFISYSGLADYYVDFHTPCVHTADAWSKDDDFHWYNCTICGAEYDCAEHVWDNGTVKGDKTTFTCTVCAQTRIESNDHQSIAALTIDLGTIVDGVTVPNVTGFKTSRDNALATMTPVTYQWGGSVIRPGSNFFEEGAALTISTEITAKSGYYFLDSQYFPTSVYFEINGSLVRADVVFQTQYVAAATCTFTVPEAPLVEIELPQTVNPGDDMMTKLTECALNYNHTAQEIMVFAYCDGDLCAVNMNMGGSWAYSDSDSYLATLDLDPSVIAEAREMLTAQADHLYTITVTLFSSIPVERTRNDMIHISAGNAISATVDRNSNYNATAVYRPTEKHVVRIDETVAAPVPGELPVTETTTDRRVRWTPTSRFTCGTAYTVVIDRIFTDTLDPNAVAYVNGYRANVTVAGAHQARITYTFEPFEHMWGPWTAINNTQFRHTCVNDASHVENVTCSSVMVLPAALCQIESEAFAGISAEVIVIPANCQSIAFDAFDGCPNLRFIINHANTTIIPPVGVEVIGD